MQIEDSDHPDPEREIRVLTGQADRLFKALHLDISDSGAVSGEDPETSALEWYERLASAQKKTNPVSWERTVVDGRSGAELMARLWEIKEYLHQGRKTP